MKKATLRDAVYGLAVADAMGVPAEFQSRGTYYIESMVGGGMHNQPRGTWSDDTSMTLATCASIKEKGGVDTKDIRKKFCDWLYLGKYTIDGKAFDCGNTVAEALNSNKGCVGDRSNGNGSLMRVIPLAFLKVADKTIENVSAITHAHNISKYACVIYVRLAQALREGIPLKQAIEALSEEEPFQRLSTIGTFSEDEIGSGGYVVDTLEASLWCLATTYTYKDCIIKAINLGSDTDTVAAVAGGLAGIVYGYEAIPAEWIDVLRGKDIIDNCLFRHDDEKES